MLTVPIRWANTITCPTDIGEFLRKYQSSEETFSIQDIGEHNKETLAKLFFKDVIECKDLHYNDLRSMAGLSSDI
ncbi:MAG: hypothetical protein NTX75_09535 [Proteobacteria bacterium]|nr:hypothetical protein [Pseudomonadota bacterium]